MIHTFQEFADEVHIPIVETSAKDSRLHVEHAVMSMLQAILQAQGQDSNEEK